MTKNFKLSEFDCNDGTKVPAHLWENVRLLAGQLQVIRDHISAQYKINYPKGVKLKINSGYRTELYNASEGGSPKSQHLKAKAADLVSEVLTPKQLATAIKNLIKEKKILQGGVGIYNDFTHYDCRGTMARWQIKD